MHRYVDEAAIGVTKERMRPGLANQAKPGTLQRPRDFSSGYARQLRHSILCGGNRDRDDLEARTLRVGRRDFVTFVAAHSEAQFDCITDHGEGVLKVPALRYDLWKRRHGDRKAASLTRGARFQNNCVSQLFHIMKGSRCVQPAPLRCSKRG